MCYRHCFGVVKTSSMITQIIKGRIQAAIDPPDGLYSVKKVSKTRTSQQNRLLHGVVFLQSSQALSAKLGYKVTPVFTKALLKTKFGSDYVNDEFGDVITPTSEMNTARMVKFIEDCVRYIAVYCNYYIELPGDWYSQIKETK